MTKPTLCFIVPAHGRIAIAQVCLRQLRRTCDALAGRGILASAVVVADDENLELAGENGFAAYEQNNWQLGRKLNDGYQIAGRAGFDFMAPCGSDDWIDPDWIRLPQDGETIGTHLSTVVNEDCSRMALLNIRFGDGIRIFRRDTLERIGFRPADDDRRRAMDTSTHNGVSQTGARLVFHDTHPLCIVDFKSSENLNDYDGCMRHFGRRNETTDVWAQLAKVYPTEAIAEMQAIHGLVAV